MKQSVNYEFYFYFQKYGKKRIVTNKACKYPKQTKVYRLLLNSLDKGFIHSFGYKSKETENNYIKV
jgi:hypothetical protein